MGEKWLRSLEVTPRNGVSLVSESFPFFIFLLKDRGEVREDISGCWTWESDDGEKWLM